MSANIFDLDPKMIPTAQTFLKELDNRKIKYVVTDTKRSAAYQRVLWMQGRSKIEEVNSARQAMGLRPIDPAENLYTVTRCDGYNVRSPHQSGFAMDVVPANDKGAPVWPARTDDRWRNIAKVGKMVGLTWGGDWKDFPDNPHYELEV